PRAPARQLVLYRRQVRRQPREAGLVEMEFAIRDAAAVRQYELGGQPAGLRNLDPRGVQLHRDQFDVNSRRSRVRARSAAADRDRDPLIPEKAALRIRIAL